MLSDELGLIGFINVEVDFIVENVLGGWESGIFEGRGVTFWLEISSGSGGETIKELVLDDTNCGEGDRAGCRFGELGRDDDGEVELYFVCTGG